MRIFFAVAILGLMQFAAASEVPAGPDSTASSSPTWQTDNFLDGLKVYDPSQIYFAYDDKSNVSVKDIYGFELPSSITTAPKEANESPKKPLIIPNTMILTLAPNTSKTDVEQLIVDQKLKVIKTFESTQQLVVETDLSRFFVKRSSNETDDETVLRGAIESSAHLSQDPRIEHAAPDLVVVDQTELAAGTISDVFQREEDTKEIADWGTEDIEAEELWKLAGAKNGIVMAVIDQGFSFHEDLTFIDMDRHMSASDHGNHVAGIACARHDNQKGVRGVLPRCFVRPTRVSLAKGEGETLDVLKYFGGLSKVVESIIAEIEQQNLSARIFNISLSVNAIARLGLNPDDPISKQYRMLVQIAGTSLLRAIKKAFHNDKVLFVSAGNDSADVSDGVSAQFASPFAWAAFEAKKQGLKNVIVVEAHDKTGKRAKFSNVDGDISCPGVAITSSVSHVSADVLSEKVYGKMSGTSQATPYCAAALGLLSLVLPGAPTMTELANCMVASAVNVPGVNGAPRLKLTKALEECTP